MEADVEKIDNNIQLAFLGGMKAGLEALIHGLEVVAENNNGQVSFEFVKMVSASTIADVELKLSSVENGKGLIDALNNKSKYRDWETDRKSTRLNSSHITRSRMPSSA